MIKYETPIIPISTNIDLNLVISNIEKTIASITSRKEELCINIQTT